MNLQSHITEGEKEFDEKLDSALCNISQFIAGWKQGTPANEWSDFDELCLKQNYELRPLIKSFLRSRQLLLVEEVLRLTSDVIEKEFGEVKYSIPNNETELAVREWMRSSFLPTFKESIVSSLLQALTIKE